MRLVVTLIGPDGTMRRRLVDTAASAMPARGRHSPHGPWPSCRAVPGQAVYHLRVDDQIALVAEHDLYGPLYDLVTAVPAIGAAPD